MISRKKISALVVIYFGIFCCLTPGCMSHHTETVADIDSRSWPAGQEVKVSLENSDSLSMHNIDILLRLNRRLDVDTLDLNVTILTPDSLSFTENMTVGLADKRYGGPKHTEMSVPYRKNATLSKTGNYTFIFSHNGNPVAGISAIGIKTVPAR